MAERNDGTSLFPEDLPSALQAPVECLGITFESDEARRTYFLERLKEKLPELRLRHDFPLGEDENILKLSDPPYYTACPNPWFAKFALAWEAQKPTPHVVRAYQRTPFASDVSEGKNDSIYNAHPYHTKVPHRAIMRYILHYTDPGDIVLDGFCGTGMTGVAARLCGDRKTVESLSYRVQPDGTILRKEPNADRQTVWAPFSRLGERRAILNDLSPAATFIAYNFNTPVDTAAFRREALRNLREVEDEEGWVYTTMHDDGTTKGRINYTVWSDVFVCSECAGEVIFWEAAMDRETGGVRRNFPCPHCSAKLTKRSMDRAWSSIYDRDIHKVIRQAARVPVLINYTVGKRRYEKIPDDEDLGKIKTIEQQSISYWFPQNRLFHGGETRRNDNIGIRYVHNLYTRRSIRILSALRERFKHRPEQMLLFTSQLINVSLLNRYRPKVSFPYNPLSGTLYVGSQISEPNIFVAYNNKLRRILSALEQVSKSKYRGIVGCQSATRLNLPDESCDYVFTDPPFGGNLAYAELNVLWEEWIRILTKKEDEAIESKHQDKGTLEYQHIMTDCFKEYHRVLKPGRWMTVEFHNSKNRIWNAIQESLQRAGFVVADVRTLDKKTGTFKQVTAGGSVMQDLVISAYKPDGGLEDRFRLRAGTEDGVWDFVRTHMGKLPVFVGDGERAEVITERQGYLLFDRMVAFHVQRGVTVPLSAAEFYDAISQRYPARDGMHFLPEQVAEYDRKRMSAKALAQLELFVKDEETAIQWLRQQLDSKPQTFQDIHPNYIRELAGWLKHERSIELSELLAQNFLRYDGAATVPSQIHSYLSTNFKELRNLPNDDPALRTKANDRWYVPDPRRAGDIEKLRERALFREFDEYRASTQRRLRVFRLEAVRAGFRRAWQAQDYRTIVTVAGKIPESVLQEDPKLLMWYDQAITRTGET